MKDLARVHTHHGDLVVRESMDTNYPGFFIYLERDGLGDDLLSVVEVENDPDAEYAATIVTTYSPEGDDPDFVDRISMHRHDAYFAED